jgi:hypothetical protein
MAGQKTDSEKSRQIVNVPANGFLETLTSVLLHLLFYSMLPSIEMPQSETVAFVVRRNFNNPLFHSHNSHTLHQTRTTLKPVPTAHL